MDGNVTSSDEMGKHGEEILKRKREKTSEGSPSTPTTTSDCNQSPDVYSSTDTGEMVTTSMSRVIQDQEQGLGAAAGSALTGIDEARIYNHVPYFHKDSAFGKKASISQPPKVEETDDPESSKYGYRGVLLNNDVHANDDFVVVCAYVCVYEYVCMRVCVCVCVRIPFV